MKSAKHLGISLLLGLSLMGSGCGSEKTKVADVYPVPQQMEHNGYVSIPEGGYRINSDAAPDSDAMALLSQIVSLSPDATNVIAIRNIAGEDSLVLQSGAYTLDVTSDSIIIGINDGRSLFYAVQTLSQLVEPDGTVAAVSIKDYPDVPFRGVVEGFYGTPWSFENRASQLEFYGRMKMNTYIYGPKDDPYHRSPYWREPYPADQAAAIRELVAEAGKNKVDFVWALHPGMDIKWNEADRKAALRKLNSMYDLGVRAFAVFFDDIDGDQTDAMKQVEFMNFLKKEFVDAKGDISQLLICPTEYNKGWAKTDYLDVIGANLDPSIKIMWTGNTVCGDITKEGLDWVNNRIKRPAYVWWNFPVSDYTLAHLLMGPASGIDTAAQSDMSAFVSNPMEYAEASKVALYGVGQYTWNMSEYDPMKSWIRAADYIVPEAPEAFRLFCETNSDIGPNTWMYFHPEQFRHAELLSRFSDTLGGGGYDEADAAAVNALFGRLISASDSVRDLAANKELVREIDPWLVQTANVGRAGQAAIQMLAAAKSGDKAVAIKGHQDTKAALQAIYDQSRPYRKGEQDGIRSGSQVLMPLIYRMVESVEAAYPETAPATRPRIVDGSVLGDSLEAFREDDVAGIGAHFRTITMKPGEYFGVVVEPDAEPVELIYDLRRMTAAGREFQGSANGISWKKLGKDGAARIDTIPIADKSVRYVRCINNSKDDKTVGIGRFGVITTTKANGSN